MTASPSESAYPTAPSTVPGVEAIVAEMTDAIHEHRIQPGAKLREDELGDIFNVSRTLVRQALHKLEHSGLVTIQRNRGAFVAKPSIKEAREVFEARALLEPQTARAAAERASAQDIECLEKHIEDEHAAIHRNEMGLALKLSGDFHLEIARIADQDTIEAFLRQLISRSSLVIALYWRRRNAICESHAHHALIDALRDGDCNSAEELMKGHLLDIFSQLDLRDRPDGAASLKEALKR
ncbi:FCD domain-containing protein [Epibacterium sp. SM1979]|uniref:FCD domain-containing protein n=1 Tax=Tritonibacter litoralis TaxID=2662264 RepID=A0A843YJ18_9RHOB|nr:GntR family transcriptional regulator [Tritonibacter litoralis]MQQ09655.1 FCD domain-containing protein [Tritonibacter litoralis]